MLLKVLSTFLVIQFFSFAIWQSLQAWKKPEPKPVSAPISASHEAAQTQVQAPINHVRFTARTKRNVSRPINPIRKNKIINVLAKLPADHIKTLKNIILDYDPKAHRGLGGRSMIILRAVNIDPTEFVGVLVHEIGHNVDLGHLSESNKLKKSEFIDGRKPVYEGDPSLDFYRISWKNDQTRKKTTSNLDFVSGYALSDPFEDFAESYVYYILHNKKFKSLTQTSDKLLAKYQFMKNKVFEGKEFDTGKYLTENLWRRPWDITVLSYDLETFLKNS